MNELPNLDYNLLNKLLNKKALEGLRDPDDEPQSRTTIPTIGMGKLQKEIETLKEQLDEARGESRYSDASKIKKEIEKLEDLVNDVVNSPQIQEMVEAKKPPQEIYKVIDRMIEGRRKREKVEGIPLEEQLEQAIKEERYEDAVGLQEQLNRLRGLKVKDEKGEFVKLMKRKVINANNLEELTDRQKKIIETIDKITEEEGLSPSYIEIANILGVSDISVWKDVKKLIDKRYIIPYSPRKHRQLITTTPVLGKMIVSADNLDLVEINKPYDEPQPLQESRKRHRWRYRNEPQGQDELFWEGMGGTRNVDKGIGSDQYQDVGVPSSISLAKSRWQRRFRPLELNMPNEKMERDPLEEKQTTDTWREFYDMQQR